jgi:hypothetical protein
VAAAVLAAATVLLYACRDSTDPPPPPEPVKTFHLTLNGNGSTANGTLTTNRGGIACAVSYSAQLTTSGTCAADYDSGLVVAITGTTPPSGAVSWTGCDAPVTDNPLLCQVTMSSDRGVAAAFSAPPSSFGLTYRARRTGAET